MRPSIEEYVETLRHLTRDGFATQDVGKLTRARKLALRIAGRLDRRLKCETVWCAGCGALFLQTHKHMKCCSRNCSRRVQYQTQKVA